MKKYRNKMIAAALMSVMLISTTACTADGQIDSAGLQSALESFAAEVSANETEESSTVSETTEPEESSESSPAVASESSESSTESSDSKSKKKENSKEETSSKAEESSKKTSSKPKETSTSSKPAEESSKAEQTSSKAEQSTSKPTQTNTTPKNVPVKSISLDKHSLNLTVGNTGKLTATLSPSDTTEQRIEWSWSNKAVVTVDADGTVHAVGAGSATITVTCANGTSDSCTVTVKKKETASNNTSSNNTSSNSSNSSPANQEFQGKYEIAHYYRSETSSQIESAEKQIKNIAESIMTNPEYKTELQKVRAAANIVANYCLKCNYGIDPDDHYRSPYGVLVAKVYTCAGSTSTLGRILDYMGFDWKHENYGEYSHQWCVLKMDGKTGFADGMNGATEYGKYESGMELSDGTIVYF